ncbi:hypothetical protein M8C21_024686 [Ambrosia artemisiifolia]|uniref:Protein kinase domain-containing protein n=1 Tax=Ambrosia artemisiifolia TaxID=4212 RepID=A0AAD5GHU6_AMBAR|nr:hypothetical protein M8C21_024686 [Ambrosia artemisiifolia]
MAPEVYRRESYDKSVDVYSFAFIVHEGGPSNSDELPEHLAAKRAYENSRPPLSSYIYPEPVRMLLQKCWHRNPDVRPKFEEIIIELEFILEIERRKLADGLCRTCGIL